MKELCLWQGSLQNLSVALTRYLTARVLLRNWRKRDSAADCHGTSLERKLRKTSFSVHSLRQGHRFPMCRPVSESQNTYCRTPQQLKEPELERWAHTLGSNSFFSGNEQPGHRWAVNTCASMALAVMWGNGGSLRLYSFFVGCMYSRNKFECDTLLEIMPQRVWIVSTTLSEGLIRQKQIFSGSHTYQ